MEDKSKRRQSFMPQTVKMIFRLLKQSAEMDLLWFLRDTRYCLLQIFADSVTALASVSAVLLLGWRFGGIGGMTLKQILFLCGYAVTVDGIMTALFGGNNVAYISRVIGRGQLDHMLIQPVPLWMQLLTEGFDPFSGSSRLICGLAILSVSIAQNGICVTPLWIAGLVFSLICSVAVILAVVYIVSFSAFFAPVAAEEISAVVMELFGDIKFYPLGGLSARAAAAFCTVVPVGLAAWFPSCALLGRAPDGLPAGLTFFAAAILTAAAALLFRKGIQYYEKSGCIRYTGFGHR